MFNEPLSDWGGGAKENFGPIFFLFSFFLAQLQLNPLKRETPVKAFKTLEFLVPIQT